MRMRPAAWLLLLLLAVPPLFLLWCLLAPPLLSYHPFHPNHPHLPSSYVSADGWLSRHSPSYLLSSAIVPSSYIEGWYLKLRSAGGRHLALIFMYFVSADSRNSTAAVTLLDADRDRSHLYQYPIEHFGASPLPSLPQSVSFLLHSAGRAASSPYHDFELHVANNTLSPYAVTASLQSAGQTEAWLSAEVRLSLERPRTEAKSSSARSSPWSSVFSPASHTVGLFAFLPLACYQQVIELQLAVNGHVSLDGHNISFDGGTAYLEKTRGSTFPDSYLWIHASHFAHSNGSGERESDEQTADGLQSEAEAAAGLSSFFFSVASVPILPTSLRLPGFVCSFVLDGRTFHFATQLGSILAALRIDDSRVEFALYDQHFSTRVAVAVSRHPTPVHKDSWLWAARNGRLRRVIPQQIGKDSVHVSVQHITAADKQSSAPHGGSMTDWAADGRSELGLDADSFSSHGYSLSSVLSARSSSVGLEVFVHEEELQRQVAVMYDDVRPWLSDRYFPLDTPLVSFSISTAFVRSLLPTVVCNLATRLGIGIRHILLVGCVATMSLVASVLLLLVLSVRRTGQKVKSE